MNQFIAFFYGLFYSEADSNYYWAFDSQENCLTAGFWTLIACSVLVTAFFYFMWTNTKVYQHATLRSWLVFGLIGMLLTFVATEVVIGLIVGVGLIGEDNDVLWFSLIHNGLIGFSICYILLSTIMQNFSNNAKNIPWHFFVRNKN